MKPIWTLLALAISAFAIGSTEFISVGLLPLITEQFGVSLNVAGLTVSLYALGVTIGAPLLTMATSRMHRKHVLLIVMLVFITGNTIAALAPTFSILLSGRVISALAHGVFMSIASIIAADVVAPNKRASAIAFMFSGLTIATVTGVPLGTWIGQFASWRMSFIFIAVIGIIGLIANAMLVPKQLSQGAKMSLRDIKTVLTNYRMLLVFFITAIGYGGTFVMYTYLSPILEQVLHFSPSMIVLLLVVYGIFVAIGNSVGGRLSNEQPLPSLFGMFAALSITLFVLQFALHSSVIGLIVIFLVGLFMFMNVPGLQLYAVQLAEKYTPNATAMASALNISAFNIGIVIGSYVGGFIVAHHSLTATPIYASALVFIAVAVTGIWLYVEKRQAIAATCQQ